MIKSSIECDNLTNELKHLGLKNNIKIFKKSNHNFILRDSHKIINECNKMKKKTILYL